mgnify:FL=1
MSGRFTYIVIALMLALSCSSESFSEEHHTESVETQYRLTVDGKPFLMLGAQLRTDFFRQLDGKTLEQLDEYFSLAAGLNITCVQVPVSWSDVETDYDIYTGIY